MSIANKPLRSQYDTEALFQKALAAYSAKNTPTSAPAAPTKPAVRPTLPGVPTATSPAGSKALPGAPKTIQVGKELAKFDSGEKGPLAFLQQSPTPTTTPWGDPVDTPAKPDTTTTTPATTTPATTTPASNSGFTSSFPELANMTFNTKAELDAAEAEVLRQRDAKTQQESLRSGYATMATAAVNDPESLVTNPGVAEIPMAPGTTIPSGTGTTGVNIAQPTTAKPAIAGMAPNVSTTKASTSLATGKQTEANKQTEAAQGQVGDNSLVSAALQDPNFLAQLGLSPAQIEQITQIIPPGSLQASEGQMVDAAKAEYEVKAQAQTSAYQSTLEAAQRSITDGELVNADALQVANAVEAIAATMSTLDEAAVAKAASGTFSESAMATAAQGTVSKKSTVQGQLANLMEQFNAGTPAWAAGGMRAATAAMKARGLGGSSMAGAAIVQAAMESAVPIAMADAETFARMGLTNLGNRQQVALANAAAQQGMELANLSNEQQAAMQTSVNAFNLQSQNLSNEQQVVVANAQFKAALQEKNMDIATTVALTNAARVAEVNNINLSNRQQANLQRSTENLQVEMTNLSNKQQTALANAQIRASILGQELSNDQQANVLNAARVSEIANINFSAEQTVAIENSRLAQTANIANLNARQAKVLSDAAAMSNMDMANLSNEQQAAVQNAQAFLQTDLTNLSYEQQTEMFKAQALQQAILGDQAALNSTSQFNASSDNQVKTFMANLQSGVRTFNASQQNAMKAANMSEVNAMRKFSTEQVNLTKRFNAENSLVIAQANAQWRQNVATINTAAQNESNMEVAKTANAFTAKTLDELWQRERDLMDFAFKSSENERDRAMQIVLADKQFDEYAKARKDEEKAAFASSIFQLLF